MCMYMQIGMYAFIYTYVSMFMCLCACMCVCIFDYEYMNKGRRMKNIDKMWESVEDEGS